MLDKEKQNLADSLFETHLLHMERCGLTPSLDESARKLHNAIKKHIADSIKTFKFNEINYRVRVFIF